MIGTERRVHTFRAAGSPGQNAPSRMELFLCEIRYFGIAIIVPIPK